MGIIGHIFHFSYVEMLDMSIVDFESFIDDTKNYVKEE